MVLVRIWREILEGYLFINIHVYIFCFEFSDICILKALHYVCAFKIWREREIYFIAAH